MLAYVGLVQAGNAKAPSSAAFELITLGDSGGIQDGNLSAFLLRSLTENNYIALDAGSIVNGIDVALEHNAFAKLAIANDPEWHTNGTILRQHVKGYFISHGHLDHTAGMLISSPQDSSKPIYALPSVHQTMLDTYFNWQAWANFTDRGIKPQLKKYQLIDLMPKQTLAIKDTSLNVTAMSLSHPLESAVFIIEKGDDLFVYFGDTGPDAVEKQGKLKAVWQYLAQQLKSKTLRAMVIEVSFDNQRPNNLLFGHLTPKWLMTELNQFNSLLATTTDKDTPLQGAQIVISHIKYSLAKGPDPRIVIKQQLEQANNLGIKFILAKQGQRLEF
ncbi:3',5'-cyclic-nucleotide phosphodiesterase [Paraglaciecola aquimarina]|uniref:3',5'-cyclic-nucleotide phosphodiesterase n=1 Tax=Paraglaciecola aquimarina TaxID=1235557 RepID=A0ABU3SU15_9ALTE|nr:3',5'-cyclic-nucleotide phosphodiesterase [Paraglaciecola aquimarina]MDU0353503.1 3',5'-cyclic-nucleotide phosphodiesterase [Paraglaciecola aquimarina]